MKKYIRVEIYDEKGCCAWSQPFFVNSDGYLEDPYLPSGNWYKGNVHTHTNNSDGWFRPEEVKEIYQKAGYHFLALTDHNYKNYIGADGKCYLPPIRKILNSDSINAPPDFVVFSGYEASYHYEWHIDEKLYRSAYSPNDRLSEDSPVKYLGAQGHLLAINYTQQLDIIPHEIQHEIDSVNRQGGFVIWHQFPWQGNFDVKDTLNIMSGYQGYLGVEIFNTAGNPKEVIKLWDGLLTMGRKIWGFATDDFAELWWPHFKGYIMVKAKANTRKDLLDAVKRGSFYSSTGIKIKEIYSKGKAVYVSAPEAERIKFIGSNGKILSEGEGNRASYSFDKRELSQYTFDKTLNEESYDKNIPIGHYKFISDYDLLTDVIEKYRKRFPGCHITKRILGLRLNFYEHPIFLEKILLEDFCLMLYQESDWWGCHFSFEYDKKLWAGLGQFDLHRQVAIGQIGRNYRNFIRVLRLEDKIFVEMCFRLNTSVSDEQTFIVLEKFFLELRENILNRNFKKMQECLDYYEDLKGYLKL